MAKRVRIHRLRSNFLPDLESHQKTVRSEPRQVDLVVGRLYPQGSSPMKRQYETGNHGLSYE